MIRTVLSSVAAATVLSISATGPAHSRKSQPGSAHVPLSLGDGSTIEARKGPIQKSKPGGAHVPMSLGDGSTRVAISSGIDPRRRPGGRNLAVQRQRLCA